MDNHADLDLNPINVAMPLIPESAPPKFKVLSTAAVVFQVQGGAASQYRERRLSTLVCGDSVTGEHSAPGRHPMLAV